MRTLITTIATGLAVVAPAAAAQAREPVTRVEVLAAAHHLADRSAATAENHSATGIEDLTNGAARIDRSRTSIGSERARRSPSSARTPSTARRTRSCASATSRSCGPRTAAPA